MATAAFKSTSKRSPINSSPSSSTTADAGSSNRTGASHRRSRSVSRFSGRYSEVESDEIPTVRRGRFVNTERGSGFPEVSLDDLANEFFPLKDCDEGENRRGRSTRRSSGIGPSYAAPTTTSSAQRRARSVSRQHTRPADKRDIFENSSSASRSSGVDNNNSRRRRSVSVARYQFSDSESDHSNNSNSHGNLRNGRTANNQRSSVHKPTSPNRQRVLRRSLSHKDLLKSQDGYSSDHSNNSNSQTSLKSSVIANDQRPSVHKPTAGNHQRVLRRSMSHKDLLKPNDGYSSQSSVLTDDESRDACYGKHGNERTIRAVYSQTKTEHPTGDGAEAELYEAMRKELIKYAVKEIKTEFEQGLVKTNPSVVTNIDCLPSKNSNVLQAVSLIRENYASQLEQSEKRKQDLLAEMVVEEQRGRELSTIVKGLLPDPKRTDVPQKPLRTRKRSNDRSRMSKCLTEEAEKYFEDFISNVEDTDISSLDGERSDASSKLGRRTMSRDPTVFVEETEKFETPIKCTSIPVEMDGVVLPWLEWETSNDGSSLKVAEEAATPKNNLYDAAQEMSPPFSKSNCLNSSLGSWSPSPSTVPRDVVCSKYEEPSSYSSKPVVNRPKKSSFDMDEYFQLQHNENMLFEAWRQRERINSGGLLLCTSSCLQF